MLVKTQAGDPEGLVRKRFIELLGQPSVPWPLPNMEEVSETDFWWHRSSYSFRGELSTSQIKTAERSPSPRNTSGHPEWSNLMLYLVDHGSLAGGGFCVQFIYNNMNYNGGSWDPAFPAVRYYKWRACAHEYEETGPEHRRGRGWHEYTCKKCGAQHSVDSGD